METNHFKSFMAGRISNLILDHNFHNTVSQLKYCLFFFNRIAIVSFNRYIEYYFSHESKGN